MNIRAGFAVDCLRVSAAAAAIRVDLHRARTLHVLCDDRAAKSLAFGRLPWKTGQKEPAQIYVVDMASRNVITLPESNGLFAPHWFPDGRHLLAAKADSSAFLLFGFSTQKWTTLATGLMGFPIWSRDSSYVYALDVHLPQQTAIIRIRVNDAKIERVADLSSIRQITMPWIGLDPDDTPLAIREVGTEEIYVLQWATP